MNVQIRIYEQSDRASIVSALDQLHKHVVAIDPDKRLRHTEGYATHEFDELLEVIKKQGGQIFIAEDGDTFLGFTAGFMTEQSQENLLSVIPTRLGVISDVFVAKSARGMGLGQKLMKKIEDFLIEAGADTIWIDIVAFNHDAHNFYKKLGYKDREIGLMKRV